MKKVLFIIESLNGGGAEKVLYDIVKNIDKTKYKIDILLLRNQGVYIEKIQEEGIKIDYIFDKRRDLVQLKFYRKIKSFFLRGVYYFYYKYLINKKINNKYDIEIAFLEGWSTYLLANRKSKAKKIAWVHIDLEKHKTINRRLEKKAYLKMDKIICVSNDSKKSVENLYTELKEKIEVLYNPIPTEEILEKSKIEDTLYPENKINLVTVGRLSYQKGYDVLLEAHNKLLKEGLDYNLYILGEGEERKNYNKYIKENNLGNNTFLLGFKENPYPYIKQADIFISSSRYEGYPLVLCEALCLEKPIVATSCTGPSEILENGKYGLLSEVEKVESLAENMKKLILDKNLRKKYSDLASERAQMFDMNKTIRKIEGLFNE